MSQDKRQETTSRDVPSYLTKRLHRNNLILSFTLGIILQRYLAHKKDLLENLVPVWLLNNQHPYHLRLTVSYSDRNEI
jgi:hypothetical protein